MIPRIPLSTRPEILSCRQTRIPALLTRPEKDTPCPWVMAVHGFNSSKSEFGLYDKLSCELAKNGIACIRFDFAGCGESSEPFTAYDNKSMQSDMDTVFGWMLAQEWTDKYRWGVQGYSMGGRETVLFASRHPQLCTMSLWAAGLSNGTELVEGFLGGEKAMRANFEIARENGFFPQKDEYGQRNLSYAFITQNMFLNPYTLLEQYHGSIFFAQGLCDKVVHPKGMWYAELAAKCACLFQRLALEDVGHDFGTGFEVGKKLSEKNQAVMDRLVSETSRYFLQRLTSVV